MDIFTTGQLCRHFFSDKWTENINYKVVDDRCYYFQNTFSHYIPTHRGFCKTLFSGNGRLFEPKNLATLQKVYNVAKDNFKQDVWFIGLRL